MLPPGHLVAGYLPYSLYRRARGQRPLPAATLLLAFGTQLPDLIDKTFTWIIPVLPSGRSFGHSLLVFALFAVPLFVVARRRGHVRRWVAFAFGVVSHQLLDAANPIALGVPQDARFLAWPLTTPVYYADDDLFIQVQNFELSTAVLLQAAAGLLVVALWVADGAPGLPWRRSD